MPSSFHLLISILHAGFHPQAKRSLIAVIDQVTKENWQNTLKLSDYHNVSNLLRSALRKNKVWHLLPDYVQHSLDTRYHNSVAWSLKLSHLLEQVIPAFTQARIPIIPWKGSSLSERLFDNIWEREYVDLDFLLLSQYQSSAESILHELGCLRNETGTHEPPSTLANNNDHCQLWQHQDSQTLLELHWKPFPSAFRFTPPLDSLFARSTSTPYRSIKILQLSLEDEFLLLVGHGAKHHWSQLNWLCDFAQFIQRYGTSLNWTYINVMSNQSGLVRIIKTALFLIETLFQITPPAHSFDRPATDYTACRMACRRIKQFQHFETPAFQQRLSWKYRWFINSLLARERYRDRLPVFFSVIAYVFTPNQNDRELCPQSLPLSLIAWFVRPFRLTRKYALHPFKKNSTMS